MSETDLAMLDRETLIALVLKLQAEIEALKRAGKRQASPFSKGTRVAKPKKPGRKPGQGPFRHREAPAPEQLSEPPIDVPVAEPACPKCGGGWVEDHVEEASITDLPEVIRPRVRLFRVAVQRCADCGATARGRHADLAVDQRGASAHRLGPRLRATAHHLHYALGVPVRKLPEVFRLLAGVTLTQGAITQDALRKAAGAIGARYQVLCDSIRDAAFTHTDDTGWRQGGVPAWLMVFETDTATVYQVRPRHRNDEVRERIPSDYQGTMITDRGTSYDAAELAGVKQQKCLSHVQRSLSEVLESKVGRARQFATTLKQLLKQALALWHLRNRRLTDRANPRLRNGLGRCHDAGALLRFLDDPLIEPTNNRAERALRPAVIARKVSHCTKNARGTRAFEAWTSILRTLSRTTSGCGVVDAVVQLTHPAAPMPS